MFCPLKFHGNFMERKCLTIGAHKTWTEHGVNMEVHVIFNSKDLGIFRTENNMDLHGISLVFHGADTL